MSASDDVAKLAEELTAKGEPFVFATVVRTVASVAAKPGAKAILTADGRMAGWVGGGCALGAVKKAAQRCLDDGEARLVSVMPFDQLKAQGLRPGDTRDGIEFDKNMCPSRGVVDVFIEPVLPKPQIVVCGATPVAHAHRRAGAADWAEGATPRLRRSVRRPWRRPARAPSSWWRRKAAATRMALEAALRSPARYVAFVGSKAKVAALKESLAEKGIPPERLAELRGPAGIPIGAVTPEEIALSILADIVQARRRKGAAKTRMEAAE